MVEILFYLFATITAGGAFSLLLSKNLLHNALFLLLSLLGAAGIFVFANADFMAAAQLMVYVGGVLVLLLFGIMFTSQTKREVTLIQRTRPLQGIIVTGLLLGVLFYAINQAGWLPTVDQVKILKPSTQTIGVSLMTNYLLIFEAIAILLLLALIGAMNIAAGKRG